MMDFDFSMHEYKVNCEIQHRLHVFEYQILNDIYVHVNDHQTKIMSLRYVKKALIRLCDHDIIISPADNQQIIKMIKKIINKPVYNEIIEEIKIIMNDTIDITNNYK